MALTQYTERYIYDKGLNFTNIYHNQDVPQVQGVASSSNRFLEFDYDAAGHQLETENVDEITYNSEDQIALTKKTTGEVTVTEYYTYAAPGHRVKKVTQTVTNDVVTGIDVVLYVGGNEYRTSYTGNHLVYDGDVVTGNISTTQDNVETRLTTGHGQVAKMTRDDQGENISYSYNLINNIDSNSVEVDAQSNVISHQGFYPYGGVSSTSGNTDNKQLGYSGQELDSTSLNYYGFRYYNSQSGRWTRPDPIGFESGQINLYAMVGGNPVSLMDVYGLTTFKEILSHTSIVLTLFSYLSDDELRRFLSASTGNLRGDELRHFADNNKYVKGIVNARVANTKSLFYKAWGLSYSKAVALNFFKESQKIVSRVNDFDEYRIFLPSTKRYASIRVAFAPLPATSFAYDYVKGMMTINKIPVWPGYSSAVNDPRDGVIGFVLFNAAWFLSDSAQHISDRKIPKIVFNEVSNILRKMEIMDGVRCDLEDFKKTVDKFIKDKREAIEPINTKEKDAIVKEYAEHAQSVEFQGMKEFKQLKIKFDQGAIGRFYDPQDFRFAKKEKGKNNLALYQEMYESKVSSKIKKYMDEYKKKKNRFNQIKDKFQSKDVHNQYESTFKYFKKK